MKRLLIVAVISITLATTAAAQNWRGQEDFHRQQQEWLATQQNMIQQQQLWEMQRQRLDMEAMEMRRNLLAPIPPFGGSRLRSLYDYEEED